MERSLGNSGYRKGALALRANTVGRLNEGRIAEQKKGTRRLDNLFPCSSMDIAGTESKLVYLSFVGRTSSLPDPIHLLVQKQNEDDVRYLLDRSMPLRALTADYCSRRGLPCNALRFIYDGARISDAKSAEDLGMDDGDVINAWGELLGG
ncbi:eRF1_3 domain-containing protein [Psidium guajava]|nr:eRF1_3 domain-containing protein [Psidium guajava]